MTSIRMEPVTGPSVWRREDVEDPTSWTYELSEPMRAEITRAAAKLTEDGTIGNATREDVDLPLVGPLLREESHVPMRLEPGDLQLVDDNVTVHRRTAYEDDVAEDSRRHLLRMWINVHDGRKFPTFMSTHRWGMEPVAGVPG